MAIIGTDIKKYLSGGAANSNVDLSIGGIISSVEVTDATLHNLFDVVSSAEAAAGTVDYRCIYFKNTHGSLPLQNGKIWIQTTTPSGDTSIAIALAGEGVNGTAETPANELTAPAGESFTSPTTEGAGLAIPADLTAGGYIGLWIRRTVGAAAAAYNSDSVILRIKGDTGA